jgi:vacuole morphology and inheritance protein 14
MYNIAKVAKGEVLPYFNDIFDALCKVSISQSLTRRLKVL